MGGGTALVSSLSYDFHLVNRGGPFASDTVSFAAAPTVEHGASSVRPSGRNHESGGRVDTLSE
jgi:hypothetical protein